MKFDTVQDALRWYFNRSWIRPPADARSMQPIKISTSPRMEDTAKIIEFEAKIHAILDQLPGRDYGILRGTYHRKGQTQAEMAALHDLTDRGVRDVRDRLLRNLEPDFIRLGLLANVKFQEPIKIGDVG